MCTLARARAHTAVSTAHMHNSGATNASSHVGERNIKKRAEHKAMGRRGRETAHKGKRKEEEEVEERREDRRRERKAEEERRSAGIKGEADKEKLCVRNRKKERETLTR